jgi:hypothetical protein
MLKKGRVYPVLFCRINPSRNPDEDARDKEGHPIHKTYYMALLTDIRPPNKAETVSEFSARLTKTYIAGGFQAAVLCFGNHHSERTVT